MSDFRVGMSGACMVIKYLRIGILPYTIYVDPLDGNGYVRYVPERTCKNTAQNKDDFCCSECTAYAKGGMVDDFDCWVPVGKAFSRCPSCGAKVISD